MHQPDFDGSKHRASREAQKFDLAIMAVIVVLGSLIYWLGPVIAEVMQ